MSVEMIMKTNLMKTFMPKASEVTRDWYVIDAEGKTLGRLATIVANLLMGKHKPIYTPHADVGDYVIVVNASKLVLTGKKLTQKIYKHYTHHPGGLKEVACKVLFEKTPERIIQLALKGMLPKSVLGRQEYRRLHVYKEADHPHCAQLPKAYSIEE